MADLSEVELLSSAHDVSAFDCGRHASLNHWLQRYALQNQSSDSARTYVVHRAGRVVGYYSVAAGSVARETAPTRVGRGLANHPIPIGLLARLAVDRNEQGSGLGSALVKDALVRLERAADVVGMRAVLVHAIDREARVFYERFDFETCPEDELHLMLLMKDLRRMVRSG